MSAPHNFPHDPYKYARIAGGMTAAAVTAVLALRRGDNAFALEWLVRAVDQYDAQWSQFLTPPALSEAEMAELIAEDEAADRREAAWERAKAIAEDRWEGM